MSEYIDRIDTNEIHVLFGDQPSELSAKEIVRIVNTLIDRINEQGDEITRLQRNRVINQANK